LSNVQPTSPRLDSAARRLSGFLSGQVAVKVLYIAGLVIATRATGPAGWGIITAALSLGFILITGVNLGLNPYCTREIAATNRLPVDLIHSAFRSRFRASVLFAGATPFLLLFTIPQTTPLIAGAVVGYLLADSWGKYQFALLRGVEATRFEVLGANLEKTAFIAFAVFALLATLEPMNAAATVAVGLAAGGVLKLAIATHGVTRFLRPAALALSQLAKGAARASAWRHDVHYIRESSAFLFMAVFATVHFRVDAYMLAALKGNVAAGYYGAAYRLIEGLLFAPESVLIVFTPLLVKVLSPSDSQELLVTPRTTIGHVAGLQTAIAAVITLALVLEHKWVIDFLYGSEFGPSASLLLWLSPALLIMAANFLLGGLLTAAYMQRTLLIVAGIAALANVLLNLALIPRCGALGAVFATLGSEGLMALIMLRSLTRRVPLLWLRIPIGRTAVYFSLIVLIPNLLIHSRLPIQARAAVGLASASLFVALLVRRGVIPNPLRSRSAPVSRPAGQIRNSHDS
jgi:O-antigen/teichoic acid export membrane protein